MTPPKPRILILEDDALFVQQLRERLIGMGYDVSGVARSADEALEQIETHSTDLILINILAGGHRGAQDTAVGIRNRFDLPVIYFSTSPDADQAVGMPGINSSGYLVHPFQDLELHAAVELALAGHRTEVAFRKAREEWEMTFDALPDLIAVVDTDLKIVRCNESLARKLHLPRREIIGQFCCRVFHNLDAPKKICPFSLALEDGRDHMDEIHEPHLGGDFLFTVTPLKDPAGKVIGGIHVARDITAIKKGETQQRLIERQVYRERKDRALMTIAGGMAHEFNNILTVVMGNAELLRMRGEGSPKIQELARDIETAGTRMATLTARLLAYAKGGKYLPRRLSLPAHISEALRTSLRTDNLKGIRVSTSLEEGLWPVVGDPSQMNQMLANVISNAVEAMPHGGELAVGARNIHRAEAWECPHGALHSQGDYVLILVSDTGTGIPQDRLGDVFEPFFSTKFQGRGLGLPAVLGIVANHGGCVSLTSQEGRGTQVYIHLPRAPENDKEKGEEPPRPAPKVSGLVLAVDDEPRIRSLLEMVLPQRGYGVCTANGGLEAQEIFRNRSDEISLVILDVMMPDMRGTEVFRYMKSVRPDVPILVSSGFDREQALLNFCLDPVDRFLQKPYSGKTLLDTIDSMLKSR